MSSAARESPMILLMRRSFTKDLWPRRKKSRQVTTTACSCGSPSAYSLTSRSATVDATEPPTNSKRKEDRGRGRRCLGAPPGAPSSSGHWMYSSTQRVSNTDDRIQTWRAMYICWILSSVPTMDSASLHRCESAGTAVLRCVSTWLRSPVTYLTTRHRQRTASWTPVEGWFVIRTWRSCWTWRWSMSPRWSAAQGSTAERIRQTFSATHCSSSGALSSRAKYTVRGRRWTSISLGWTTENASRVESSDLIIRLPSSPPGPSPPFAPAGSSARRPFCCFFFLPSEHAATPGLLLSCTNSFRSRVVQRRIANPKPFERFLVLMFFLNLLSSSSRMSTDPADISRDASTTRASWCAACGVGSSSMNHRSSNVPSTWLLRSSESVDLLSRSSATPTTSGWLGWLSTKALRIREACRRTSTDVSLIRPRTVWWNRSSMALATVSGGVACPCRAGAAPCSPGSPLKSSSAPSKLLSRVRPSNSRLTCLTHDDSSRRRMSMVSSRGLAPSTEASVSMMSLKARIAVFLSEACAEFACISTQSKAALRRPSKSVLRSWR
mmetsp:Transcript_55736/g.156975  ORF Transcript_55736/g.156975 Transcript_55736/m.156975 type:complete len:551 (-) Transcript_55736:2156-3808(-)